MRSYVALLVGPLGAKNGRLVYESRELVGQTPAAFVKVAFLWLLVRAILMTMQARVGSSIVGHFPNRGAFVPDLVSGVIGLVLVMFVGGWLSLWALHRSGATYLSEPRVFTLRPGTWAGLATLNCLGAAASAAEIVISSAGLGPATYDIFSASLGFMATFFGLRSIGTLYDLRKPSLFVWTVLWPPLALSAALIMLAMLLGQMRNLGGF